MSINFNLSFHTVTHQFEDCSELKNCKINYFTANK